MLPSVDDKSSCDLCSYFSLTAPVVKRGLQARADLVLVGVAQDSKNWQSMHANYKYDARNQPTKNCRFEMCSR